MANDADRVIEVLHQAADQLDPVLRSLTTDQLTEPSAASEWDVSQVISHLGSGAEITRAGLAAALAGKPNPGLDANKVVWARWDAMAPQQRLDGYFVANAQLLAGYDALDAATRDSLRIDLGFMPAPLDVAAAGRFRLNEFTLHSWDVRVTLDPTATVPTEAAELLLDQLSFMLGWLAKPAVLDGETVTLAVTLTDPERSFGLTLAESGSSIGDVPDEPDATVEAPAEAWLRLASGRLAPRWTPSTVEVTGKITLDTLRAVFPGY